MPRNYRRTLPQPLVTDLQRKAWLWQWLTMAVSLPLLLPLTNSLEKWLPLLLPRGAAMPIPPRQVSQICVFLPIGLMLIVLGWLSVYFRVTILAAGSTSGGPPWAVLPVSTAGSCCSWASSSS